MMNGTKCTGMCSVIFATTMVLSGCDQPGMMQQKVVYVDMARVLETSSIAEQEKQRLEEVKVILLKGQSDAQAIYREKPQEEQQKLKAADKGLLSRLWEIERSSARANSIKAVAKVAEAYRVRHKLDIVLEKTQIVAADPSRDISTQIISLLKGAKVDYGKLPEVTVKHEKETTLPEEEQFSAN